MLIFSENFQIPGHSAAWWRRTLGVGWRTVGSTTHEEERHQGGRQEAGRSDGGWSAKFAAAFEQGGLDLVEDLREMDDEDVEDLLAAPLDVALP